MPLGAMNHLALTVTDMERSIAFYDAVLGFLGYERHEAEEHLALYTKPEVGAVTLSPANPDSPNTAHDRYSPGLHHFAFDADGRDDVDRLREIGATVLDPPAEYDYMPGYYAVFFADPDGIKLELAHIPDWSGAAP